MPRYRLTVEYDGTGFAGWQRQANGFAVQEALEAAIAAFTGETVTVKGAGRTDSGVHALGQVAHIDLAAAWRTDTVRDATNAHLRPHAVAVLAVEEVAADFDARFSAIRRATATGSSTAGRRSPSTPTAPGTCRGCSMRRRCTRRRRGCSGGTTSPPSAPPSARPSRRCARSTGSTFAEPTGGILVETEARSFLHRQVRSMVGSLRLVGEGRWSARDLRAALDAADRAACGPVAPAHGLYLMRVDYPAK